MRRVRKQPDSLPEIAKILKINFYFRIHLCDETLMSRDCDKISEITAARRAPAMLALGILCEHGIALLTRPKLRNVPGKRIIPVNFCIRLANSYTSAWSARNASIDPALTPSPLSFLFHALIPIPDWVSSRLAIDHHHHHPGVTNSTRRIYTSIVRDGIAVLFMMRFAQ